MTATKLVANSLALLLTTIAVADDALRDPDARHRVRADYAALQFAQKDYSEQWSRGKLSPGEAADYRIYLADLKDRLYARCSKLSPVDRTALAVEGTCPSQGPAMPSAPPLDLATERTRGEQTADLVRELNSGLSTFDDMLLREQQRVKAAKPSTGAAIAEASTQGDGTQGDGGAGADGSGQRDGDGRGDAATGKTASAVGSEAGETGEGVGTWSASGTVVSSSGAGRDVPGGGRRSEGAERQAVVRGQPPDIPDGSDDDIVARQLREAAQKETDPELKAKLWEEYRKYKRGTR